MIYIRFRAEGGGFLGNNATEGHWSLVAGCTNQITSASCTLEVMVTRPREDSLLVMVGNMMRC
jgi:hypothetical protein